MCVCACVCDNSDCCAGDVHVCGCFQAAQIPGLSRDVVAAEEKEAGQRRSGFRRLILRVAGEVQCHDKL